MLRVRSMVPLAFCVLGAACAKSPSISVPDLAFQPPEGVDARLGVPYSVDVLPAEVGAERVDRRRYEHPEGKYLDVRFRRGRAFFVGGDLPEEFSSPLSALRSLGLRQTEANPPFYNAAVPWAGEMSGVRFRSLKITPAPFSKDKKLSCFTAEFDERPR